MDAIGRISVCQSSARLWLAVVHKDAFSGLLTRTLSITFSCDSWVNWSCWGETGLMVYSHDALEMVYVKGISKELI